MVRLRREVEGVRLDPACAAPRWGHDAALAERALPGWSEARAALGVGVGMRVLICGRAWPIEVARALATGARVTVADVPRRERPTLEAIEGATERLTIVDKPWGEASLGPSSFDAALLLDRLPAFDRTDWALKKLHRELKFDAMALVRTLATGPWPTDTDEPTPTEGPEADAVFDERARRLLEPAARAARHPLTGMLFDVATREAIDRGAHLAPAGRFSVDAAALDAALRADFKLEGRWQGGSDDLQIGALLTGMRERPARLISRALAGMHGDAIGERAVAVLVRKPLGGRGGGISWTR